MAGKRTISKAKGVEMCADWMYSGRSRKEIVQELMETYGISESAVDKWMKQARPGVQERQRDAETIRTKETQAAIAESAKRLNITQERVIEQYAKIAFYDPKAELDEAKEKGDDLDPSFGRLMGIRAADANKALDSICKVLGYNAPEKKELTGSLDLTAVPIIFK